MLTSLSPFFRTQLVKLGPLGCLSLRLLPAPLPPSSSPTTLNHGRLSLSFHPGTALPEGAEVNTTGAGDSLVGAVLAGLVQTGKGRSASAVGTDEWARVVDRGQRAARASLAVSSAVGKVGGAGWEL
jgi:pseudouridine-5'-phosphate glycosidase/pseudouridine kinase